jgi:2-haloacid dehalogenase
VATVIFDLGGVVLSWEPNRAFEAVLAADEVDGFMRMIDFPTWNASHDAGRPYAEGEADLVAAFPAHRGTILAYREHFPLTLRGMVPGTGAILAELAAAGVRLFALTNWSAETFPHARERFGLLRRFEDVLVSGTEKVAKPDPAIFSLALQRFHLDASDTVFVDDARRNVDAATAAGITAHHFVDADRLRSFLVDRGLLGPRKRIPETVYHVADRAAWQAAEAGRGYPWSTRGVAYDAEGFVHCSFTHQLPRVLDRHYADVDWSDLVLLEIDTDAAPVVVEDLGAGSIPTCSPS